MTEDEGKERQAIWGVRKKHEIWFYTALLICGVAMAVFTLWKERYDENWLEIFDVLWSRIFGSVVVVWFVYQAADWSVFGLVSAGDFFRRQIERRKEEDRKRKEEEATRILNLQEQARKETKEEMQKQYDNALRQLEIPEEKIQQAHHLSDALGPWRPPPR